MERALKRHAKTQARQRKPEVRRAVLCFPGRRFSLTR